MSESYLYAASIRAADSVRRAPPPSRVSGSSSTSCEPLVLDTLLRELEIEKYRDAFAAAGIADEQINAIREAGEEAVEAMILTVGLRGGSATKVRRRCLLAAKPEASMPPEQQSDKSKKQRRPKTTEGTSAVAGGESSSLSTVQKNRSGLYVLKTPGDLASLFSTCEEPTAAAAVVVVEFKATWCGGCNKFLSTYERLVDDAQCKSAKFALADVDEAPELAQAHAVSQLPHFVIFREGKKWDVLVGGKATILRKKLLFAIEGRHFNATATENKRVS